MTDTTILDIVRSISEPGGIVLALGIGIYWLRGQFERAQTQLSDAAKLYQAKLEERDAKHVTVIEQNAVALARLADVISRCPQNGVRATDEPSGIHNIAAVR